MTQVLFNGEWLTEDQATVSMLSESVQYGYGLFETLRTYSNKSLPFVDRHIGRLTQAAADISLSVHYSRAEIAQMITKVVNNNSAELQRIKLMLLPEGLAIYSTELQPDTSLSDGVTLMSKTHQRALPEYKSTAYLDCFLAWQQAQKSGFYDALFISEAKQVLEASRANVFIIKDHTLLTPKQGVLGGIMRDVIIDIAALAGIPFDYQNISLPDLLSAEGAILTNSIIGMAPIKSVDDNKLGNLTNSEYFITLQNNLKNLTESG